MTKASDENISNSSPHLNERSNPGHCDDLSLAIEALIQQLRQPAPIQAKTEYKR